MQMRGDWPTARKQRPDLTSKLIFETAALVLMVKRGVRAPKFASTREVRVAQNIELQT